MSIFYKIYSIVIAFLWLCVLGGLVYIAILKLKNIILTFELSKLKRLFREQKLSEIRQTFKIEIHGLKFPSQVKIKKPDASALYYCNICYRTSEKLGTCTRHGFPNPLTKGRVVHLELYHRKNKRYESDDDAFSS